MVWVPRCLAVFVVTASQVTAYRRCKNSGEFEDCHDEVIGPRGWTVAEFSNTDFPQILRPDDIPSIYSPKFVRSPGTNVSEDEPVAGLSIQFVATPVPVRPRSFTREMVGDAAGSSRTGELVPSFLHRSDAR